MNKTTTPQILRPLGDMEYTYWMMGLASRTNFVVTSRLRGEIDEQKLSGALQTVQRSTPLLNVYIQPDNRHGAIFRPCPGENIPLCIDRLPDIPEPYNGISCDTPLLRRIEEEQQSDFSTVTGPLMRCLLLRHGPDDATLIHTFHHAIADALSAVAVVRRTMNTYTAFSTGTPPDLPSTDDQGPLEDHILKQYTGGGTFIFHTIRQTFSRLFSGQVQVPVQRNTWPDERRDRFISTAFDLSASDALQRKARSCNCSVHSALCAAQLLAFKKEYSSRKKIRTWLLSLTDLRRRVALPLSTDQLGLMISMVETLYTITDSTAFWDLSRRIGSHTGTLLGNGFHFSYLPTMCRILRQTHGLRTPDTRGSRQMLRQGQVFRPAVLSVSNIGTIDISSDSTPLQCKELSFYLPLSSSGLFGSAATTFNGKLHWNFSYADPAVAQEVAVRLAGNSVAILTNAIESGN